MRTLWQRMVNEWSQAGSIRQQHFVCGNTTHKAVEQKEYVPLSKPFTTYTSFSLLLLLLSFSYSNVSSILQMVAICSLLTNFEPTYLYFFKDHISLDFSLNIEIILFPAARTSQFPWFTVKEVEEYNLREFFW